MKPETREFLFKLSDLCNEYKAEFNYTNEDDGIHVVVAEEDVCIGFPMLPFPGDDIKKIITE
jgi:hypothetical protein